VPGGLLYLTTPNFRSLGRWLLGTNWAAVGPGHVCYFTPRTLRRVVKDETTFTVRTVRTKNLSAAAVRRLTRRQLETEGAPETLHKFEETMPEFAGEQALRHRIESSPLLRAGKASLNIVLRATGAGEQMEALFSKGAERAAGAASTQSTTAL
jgi:hypothetical protein